MGLSEIVAAISTVGFPIIALVVLAKHYAKREETNEKNLDKMRETVDNNTKAIGDLTVSYNNNITVLREMVNVLNKFKGGESGG